MVSTDKKGVRGFLQKLVVRAVGIPAEWQEVVLGRTINTDVDQVSALQCTALISCLRLLSSTIGMLDLGVYRRLPGGHEPATEHELHRVLSQQPNQRQTSVEWRRDMVTHMIIYGHYYDHVIMNTHEEVIRLNPLHPSRVRILDEKPGPLEYEVTDRSGKKSILPADEVLHIPYLFEGQSLFEHARKSIGLALSAEQFARKFFQSGGLQQLVLETEQTVGPDKKKEIVQSLHENMGAGRTPFTDAGTKLRPLNVKFEEVQLKDTRTHQLRDIARVMGPQPHLIGDLERSTNNNIEHQGIEYSNLTITPIAKAIEQRLNMTLFGSKERRNFFAMFDVTSIEQADVRSTAESVSKLVTSGIMTINEARRKVGLNPHPDGDRLLIQGAMVPVTQAGQEPQPKESPDGTDAD